MTGPEFFTQFHSRLKGRLTSYSSAKSRRRFTQPQLATLVLFKCWTELSYRQIEKLLSRRNDLLKALKMKHIPNYSTLLYAERRFRKIDSLSEYFDQFGRDNASGKAREGGYGAALLGELSIDI